MNSSWIGGKADTGLHERTPYWLNGIIPLAYQLNNSSLVALVNKYVDYILSNQQEDGWLGPDDAEDGNMYWSKFPMFLALTQVSSYECQMFMHIYMFEIKVASYIE